MLPDQHIIAVLEGTTIDSGVIHVCPIQGIVIFDHILLIVPIDLGVMT